MTSEAFMQDKTGVAAADDTADVVNGDAADDPAADAGVDNVANVVFDDKLTMLLIVP